MTNTLKDKVARLETANATALEMLLEVEKVVEAEAFNSIFVIAHVHGFNYKGPYINMEKLKQTIAELS